MRNRRAGARAVGDEILRVQTKERVDVKPGQRIYAQVTAEHCQIVATARPAMAVGAEIH